MFFGQKTRLVFEALQEMFYDGIGVDIFLLIEQLKKRKTFEDVGGSKGITDLANVLFTPENVEYHILILWQYYMRRKICELGITYANKTFDDSNDSLDILADLRSDLDEIQNIIESSKTVTIGNVVDNALDNIFQRAIGEKPSFYKCGHPKLDELLRLDEKKIILIGGAAKHMKTRFMLSIIIDLLKEYGNKIAVDWYCLEDGVEYLLKLILSHVTYINNDKIDSVKSIISPEELQLLELWSNKIKEWDIEYKEEPKSVKYISAEFASFAKKRPNKLNILVIDNALLVTNMMKEEDRDDKFMNELARVRQMTNGLIFVVHHFNDEQMNKENFKNAYRPSVKHLKGREAYRRIPNAICLINKPGMYKDLVAEYIGMEDIFDHLFIVDIAANRHAGGNDSNSLIRFWTIPDYSLFEEINDK